LKTLVLLLLALTTSCVTNYDRDLSEFDYLEYYRSNKEFQYQLNGEIAVVDSLPQIIFKKGQSWDYYCDPVKYQGPYFLKEIKVVSVFGDSIVEFNTCTALISGGVYTAILNQNWRENFLPDTLKIVSDLPLPHKSQLASEYTLLFVEMDDNSICYEIENSIYSTKYGRITYPEEVLVKYKSVMDVDIAKALNEYLAKRDAWFQ